MTAAIYDGNPAAPPVPTGPAGQRAWCTIDLAALRHNADVLRARAGVPLVPMVKADAYGLGVEAVARALGAPFADAPAPAATDRMPWALGVAATAEGEALRALGMTGRILCTSPVLPEELPRLAAAGVRPALHRAADVVAWRALTEAPWHLAVDTGMQRAGVPWREAGALRAICAQHPPEGVFTHFHSADRADGSLAAQEARFREALVTLQLPAGTLRHADNSWGTLARDASPWDLARPGFALYGAPPGDAGLRSALHVHARLVDLRDVPAGDTVGYDAAWTATRPSRIATAAIGYGDGYRRALSNRGEVLLHGHRVPVVGLVSMDLTMLDVSRVPCAVGDVVTLVGTDPTGASLPLGEVAERGALSPYELLVGWRARLPRVYRA